MKYFCKAYGQTIEITREQYIAAERSAGFFPKCGRADQLATGGFGAGGGVSYIVDYEYDFSSKAKPQTTSEHQDS